MRDYQESALADTESWHGRERKQFRPTFRNALK